MKFVDLLQKYAGKKGILSPSPNSNSVPGTEKPNLIKIDVSSPIEAQKLLNQKVITVHYITEPEQITDAVEELNSVDITLGFDIETAKLPAYEQHEKAGLDPHLSRIRLVQFYANRKVYIFDVDAIGIERLEPLWDCPMVAHNAIFEMKHLMNAGLDIPNIDCTMLMANVLYGYLPSLAVLAHDLLGLNISKEFQTSNWNATILSQDQLAYAALDAVLPHWLYHDLKEKFYSKNQNLYSLMKGAQKAVAKLELNGFNFDLKTHETLVTKWNQEKELTTGELSGQLGAEVNPNSSKQLSDWFEVNLGSNLLQNWPKTKRGQLKTDAETLANCCKHPISKPLLHYKKITKLLSTYGTKFAQHIHPTTGRIHANFKIAGTNTGRFSCSSPNIQNLPKNSDFRSLFTAPPGRVLIVADYNQIELRIAALVSWDKALLEAYNQGQDLHKMTASAISGVPIDQVEKAQRESAKAVNYGFLYGQGAKGFVSYASAEYGVNMTIEEAEVLKATFFKTYPQLASWQKRTGAFSRSTMSVSTRGGRDRDFTKEKNGYRYTEALNTPIQGGAAEVLLAALPKLEDYLVGTDAKLVNIIHDEIVIEAAEEDMAQVIIAMDKAMVEGMLTIFPNARIRNLVELKVGDNWAEAK